MPGACGSSEPYRVKLDCQWCDTTTDNPRLRHDPEVADKAGADPTCAVLAVGGCFAARHANGTLVVRSNLGTMTWR